MGAGLVCSRCLEEAEGKQNILRLLKEKGKIQNLEKVYNCEKKLEEFEKFFERITGFKLWSLQKSWAKRVFLGRSFAIVAPTGVGKTTFGLVLSAFYDGKVLIVVPTRMLGKQCEKKLNDFLKNSQISRKVLFYESKASVKRKFEEGDFDILIGTNAFLQKNFEKIIKIDFRLIFIDDVDSFLKRSKNIDNLFHLLQFKEEEIKLALKPQKTEKDWEELDRIRKKERKRILLLSSATLVPKSSRISLFRNLLGFDIQKAVTTLRNVEDFEIRVKDFEEAKRKSVEIIKKLGSGGLVFVSSLGGRKEAEEVIEFYKKEGIKAVLYEDMKLEEFKKGKNEVAVGISLITNPLVRGIDLPSVIKYAIFLEPPLFRIPLSEEISIREMFFLLTSLYPLMEEKEKTQADITYLRKYLNLREEYLEKYPRVKERVEKIKRELTSLFKNEEFLRKINATPDISLLHQEGKLFIVLGDASTYIQATGRTSRLVGNRLTLGVAFLFYTNPKYFNSLRKRLLSFFREQEIEFKEYRKEILGELKERLEEDRIYAKKVLEEKIVPEEREFLRTTLVIVESPSKAKTIASFFGKPQTRIIGESLFYEIPLEDRTLSITASLGHIYDLVTHKGFFGVLVNERFVPVYDTIKICPAHKVQHTDINYFPPECRENLRDKLQIIESLSEAAFQFDEVYICTDPDAEGEKIAYDLYLSLRFFSPSIKRAEFHEVTPQSFRKALREAREINLNLVKAQLVRRISDRWVGFALSQKLWEVFDRNTLSAGRVQTPVLGWIIENYHKLKEKKARIDCEISGYRLTLELEDTKLAYQVFKELEKAEIEEREEKEEVINPQPPYTTDAILKDSPFSATKTMSLLQELFEKGLITYHRTDSTRVSFAGQNVAQRYIEEKFGAEWVEKRSYFSEGAHECIRPTRPQDPDSVRLALNTGMLELEEPFNALKLYEMIFRRFIASQMKPARVKYKVVKIKLPFFQKEVSIPMKILEEGFFRINPYLRVLREVKDFKIKPVKIYFIAKEPPFTQGTLIMRMKERGLGRPSTYAQIINTLLERGYVVEKKGKLFPTPLGIKVYNYLSRRYSQFIDEEFTRKLEEEMDKIERAEIPYQQVLKRVYWIKKIV